jgi:hypothetical protein
MYRNTVAEMRCFYKFFVRWHCDKIRVKLVKYWLHLKCHTYVPLVREVQVDLLHSATAGIDLQGLWSGSSCLTRWCQAYCSHGHRTTGAFEFNRTMLPPISHQWFQTKWLELKDNLQNTHGGGLDWDSNSTVSLQIAPT